MVYYGSVCSTYVVANKCCLRVLEVKLEWRLQNLPDRRSFGDAQCFAFLTGVVAIGYPFKVNVVGLAELCEKNWLQPFLRPISTSVLMGTSTASARVV